MQSAQNFKKNLTYFIDARASENNVTQTEAKAEFASIVGKSTTIVYEYLRGTAVPPLRTVEQIATCFGLHAGDFIANPDRFPAAVVQSTGEAVPEDDIANTLAWNLRFALESKDMDVNVLSERAGITNAAVKSMLRAKLIPSIQTLDAVASALDTSAETLLFPTEQVKKKKRYTLLRIQNAPDVLEKEHTLQFSVELEKTLVEKLIDRAQEEETTPNAVIRDVLEDYL